MAAIVVPTALGLGLALLIDSRIPGGSVFKSIFYLPICLSAVVVGQIWVWIYQPDWGLLNTVVEAVSGENFNYAWLAKPDSALWSVILAWSWQQTGLSMVIFLAGLTTIPEELLEVCEIEGAKTFQRIRLVVIPLLTPATVGGDRAQRHQLAQGLRHPLHHDRPAGRSTAPTRWPCTCTTSPSRST